VAPGPVITGGIYAWTRHPIYVGFDLLFVGTFLVLGRLIFLLLALVMIPTLDLLMRREERFLREKHAQDYQTYCDRVGRYHSVRAISLCLFNMLLGARSIKFRAQLRKIESDD
jgi:protein-S-isoprenylcysteine O-methyltransferase Ste14